MSEVLAPSNCVFLVNRSIAYHRFIFKISKLYLYVSTCNLTLTVSRGNVIQSAIQAAVPAVNSWILRPGVLGTCVGLITGDGTVEAVVATDEVVVVAWGTGVLGTGVLGTTWWGTWGIFVTFVTAAILIFLVSFIRVNDNTTVHSNRVPVFKQCFNRK